jgi:DNA polymerase-3 subunit epsilon
MSDCREIVIDTETTGLSHKDGDRIIEIGCVELINKSRTGNNFHAFINPEAEVNPEAFRVHGISNEFLMDKPKFKEVTEKFLAYVGSSNLVIHNAPFDIGFLNMELSKTGHQPINIGRVVDTLILARKKFPGAPASLDALCRKYSVNLDTRDKHGALIDAELLAQVYVQLTGNNQSSLNLFGSSVFGSTTSANRKSRPKRDTQISAELEESHKKFINEKLKNPIWNKINS